MRVHRGDKPHVVVAGAGVAGLETIMALRTLAGDRVAITLVSPGSEFFYAPFATAQAFATTPIPHQPLAQIAEDWQVEHVTDTIDWVLPGEHRLFLHTRPEMEYDGLVVAVGARRYPPWPGVLTFRGYRDVGAIRELADEVARGKARHVVFVVPPGVEWTLPIYELALRLSAKARSSDAHPELTVVTPEPAPLSVLGKEASAELTGLLSEAGVGVEAGIRLTKPPDSDRVVALPAIEGPGIHGLPSDEHGFIPIDPYCFVLGATDVYGAGDCVSGAIKQGGLAAQHADVVAGTLARGVGITSPMQPLEPVLRGMLLTADKRRFFRSERGSTEVSEHALWWPALKLAGTYLAPYLELHDVPPERHGQSVEATLVDRTPVTAAR